MLKNKFIVRKIRNIVILIMAMIVMIGAYRNIGRSRAEDVIEIGVQILDNYGYLQNELLIVEAKEIEDDLYEIELPESVDTKKIEQIVNVTLEQSENTTENATENTTGENAVQEETTPEENAIQQEMVSVEIVENKIQLTKEQIENQKINIEVIYGIKLLGKNENGELTSTTLIEIPEEERTQIEITEETQVLYNKILKYEDKDNAKLVEVKGFLPIDAKLQIEEVTQKQLTEIFGEKKINVAYDIKIIREVVTQIPTDEADPDAQPEEIIEIVEINPEDFGEVCEVLIKDAKIQKDAKVYHVKEDNTYESVNVKENTEENVSFEAHTFSIYAVGPEIEDEGIVSQSGVVSVNPPSKTTSATSITVSAESSPGDGRINEYAWSTGPDDATDWVVIDTPGYVMEFTKTGTGIFYLHVLTDSGNTGMGGPYILGEVTTLTFSPTSQTTYTKSVTVNVTESSSTGRISHIVWSTSPNTPAAGDWTSVSSSPETTRQFTKNTGAGKFYLHVKTADAITGVGGPYYIDNAGPIKPTILGSSDWTNVTPKTFTASGGTDIHSGFDKYYWKYTDDSESGTLSGTGMEFNDEQNKSIVIYAIDKLGNWSTVSDPMPVRIDKTAPTAGSLTMKYGNSSGSAYPSGTWTNQDVYIAKTNGSDTLGRVNSGHGSTTYTVIKDGSTLYTNRSDAVTLNATGQYSITVKTTDVAGNSTTNSTTWYVYIDKNPPTGTISASPTEKEGDTYYTNQTSFTAYVSDVNDTGGSGLRNSSPVEINAYAGGNWTSTHSYGTTTYNSSTGVYSAPFTFSDIVDTTTGTTTVRNGKHEGKYNFNAHIRDNATNDKLTPTLAIIYDKTEPTLTVDPISTEWRNSALTTTISATDPTENAYDGTVSGLKTGNSYQYYISKSATALDGGTWTNYTASGSTITLNPGVDGEYYIFVRRVSDKAGNTSTTGGTATTISTTTYQRFGPYKFDYTKPEVKYTHQSVDINTATKTYTMTFTITDDHYSSGVLELSDLEISMENGQLDGSGNPIVYDLQEEPVTIAFRAEEIKQSDVLKGHTYTITISDLEQLEIKAGLTTADYSGVVHVSIPATAANKISDIAGNKVTAQTITSGVNIPGGSGTGEIVDVVDPLWTKEDPKIDFTNKVGTIKLKGTDTYLSDSTLTNSDIELYINGTKNTTIIPTISTPTVLTETRNNVATPVQYGVEYTITVPLSSITDEIHQVKIIILEDAIKDNAQNGNKDTTFMIYNALRKTNTEMEWDSCIEFFGNTTVERRYTKQVIFADSLSGSTAEGVQQVWDVSALGDGSIKAWTSQTERPFTVYIGSDYEIFANQDSTALFAYIAYTIGEIGKTPIKNLDLLNTSSVTNMSYMFDHVAARIESFDLGNNFDTSNVTNMENMFNGFSGGGYMKSFILPDSFDTSKVTSMRSMFGSFGYSETQLATFDLGPNFDTSNVTNMRQMFSSALASTTQMPTFTVNFDTSSVTNMFMMFYNFGSSSQIQTLSFGDNFNTSNVTSMYGMFQMCGKNAMTTLNLGNNFDTSKVSGGDMQDMFKECGYNALTSLNLGNKFNTENVTDMSEMFSKCGYMAMTSLDLGDKFNTKNVRDMYKMFENCGYTSLTSLDLGELFQTNIYEVNMKDMFKGCGYTSMTSLDLGPAFTWIGYNYEDMFVNTGKPGHITIKAPEAIYANRTTFKRGAQDATTVVPQTVTYDESGNETSRTTATPTIELAYKPEWAVTGTTVTNTETTKKIDITLAGATNANYTSNVTTTLNANDITVWIGNTKVTNVQKTVSTADPATGASVTHTVTLTNFEETLRQYGKLYKEWSGNFSLKIKGRGEATSTYSEQVLKDEYGNQSMMATDETGTWLDVVYTDTPTDRNTNGKQFADFVEPEVVYESSSTNKNQSTKKLTLEFTITDKYYTSANLVENDIVVVVDGEIPGDTNGDGELSGGETLAISRTMTSSNVTATVDGASKTIGKRYTVVISDFEQDELRGGKKYLDYSGIVSIRIPAGKVADTSGNTNAAETITVGVDFSPEASSPETPSTTPEIVDFVNPKWTVSLQGNTLNLQGTDKYFQSSSFTTDKIKIYIDGVLDGDTNGDGVVDATPSITKTLSGTTDIEATVDEVANTVIGKEYTVVLDGLNDGAGHTEFTPTVPIVGGTAQYRNAGTTNMKIVVEAGTLQDKYGNTNEEVEIELSGNETTQVEIYPVQHSSDTTNQTETIIFNVTDRFYDKTDLIHIETNADGTIKTGSAANELVVKHGLDVLTQVQVHSFTNVEIKTMIGGVETVVGHQYTLQLKNFEETDSSFKASSRKYKDFSGDFQVVINSNAAKNTLGNNINLSTCTLEYFIDLVKPFASIVDSEVDAVDQVASAKIEITDKYFKVGTGDDSTLTSDEIEIWINGTKVEAFGDIDGNGEINGSELLTAPTLTLASPSTVTENRGGINTQVGVRYNINITGFAQDVNQIKIRIIPDAVVDQYGNGNKQIDLLVYNTLKKEEIEYSIYDYTCQNEPFLGEAAVKRGEIRQIIFTNSLSGSNDAGVATVWDVSAQGDGSIKAWTSQTTSPYTVYIGSDYEIFANQNSRCLFAFIGFNVGGNRDSIINLNLLNTSSVTNMSYMFNYFARHELNNNGFDFEDNFDTSNVTDMSYMFYFFGQFNMGSFTLPDSFDTSKVTDMHGMFGCFGYSSQNFTNFDLGANFDTSNVTNMAEMFKAFLHDNTQMPTLTINLDTSSVTKMDFMFAQCGYKGMETLNLGTNFDTSNVENMKQMFSACGYTAMTTLNLGSNFDTSSVTDMQEMFSNCGYTAMTSLNLGTKFDTSNVEMMGWMFSECGYTAMTTLNLGDKFDTTKVWDMQYMFRNCGYTAMTSLDLGNKFNTSSAIFYMYSMFKNCGYTAMTSLDLGPAFTKIANLNTDMFVNTGKTGAITIKAPEAIYANRTTFKLSGTATATITPQTVTYDESGNETSRTTATPTIDLAYKPEWSKISTTVNTEDEEIILTVKGTAYNAGKDYASNVTTNLAEGDIHIFVDGQDATAAAKPVITIGEPTTTTNATSGKTEITQTITLSDWEELTKQTGKSFLEWSGNLTIKIAGRGQATSTYTNDGLVDEYGNKAMMETDETGTWAAITTYYDSAIDHNTTGKLFADFLKPELHYDYNTTDISTGAKSVTVVFSVTDKYYSTTSTGITEQDLTIMIDGVIPGDTDGDGVLETGETFAISRTFESSDVTATVNGTSKTVGKQYKVVLKDFEQPELIGSRKYLEYAGIVTIAIPEGKFVDASGNVNSDETVTVGIDKDSNTPTLVDFIKPRWTITREGEGIKLEGIDEYFAQSTLTTDKIKIYLNGVLDGDTNNDGVIDSTPTINKILSTPIDIKDTVDGVENTVIGKQYTLSMNGLGDETGYTEFTPINPIVGGTAKYKNTGLADIRIVIEAGTLKDRNNNLSDGVEKTFINSNVSDVEIYPVEHSSDPSTQIATIIFNVTDKYYDKTDLINIETDASGRIKISDDDNELVVKQGGNNLTQVKVHSFTNVEIKTTVDGSEKVVGHQYTLQLTGFEESDASFKASSRKYKDFSGDIQVVIDEGAARNINGNAINTSTNTLTYFIDLVKPFVKKESSYASSVNQEGSVTFTISDKYFNEDDIDARTLTNDEIEVWINGTKVETFGDVNGNGEIDGLEIESEPIISSPIILKETIDGTPNTQYAVRYTVSVSGFAQGIKQIKIVVLPNAIVDKYGNGNAQADNELLIYNTLKKTDTEMSWSGNSNFFGNSTVVRQYIQQIIFTDSLAGSTEEGVQHLWDVSEQGDGSIMAWTSQSTAPFTVYIGSEGAIFANPDSTALFAHIGAGVHNEGIDVIVNLNLLNTSNVTNMSKMFCDFGRFAEIDGFDFEDNFDTSNVTNMSDMFNMFGYWNMKSFTIPDTFDTSNVTNMGYMFVNMGEVSNQFSSFDLGSNFDTSNVTNMAGMFWAFGKNSLEELRLGTKFNTSKVTNMALMFDNCGYTAMTSLNLGSNFDTSSVTDMSYMFRGCGYTAMTSLNLGSKFDTSSVTDMSYMFSEFGYTVMTSLNLGDKFDTSNVTNMNMMFDQCGYTSMTSLTLPSSFNTSNVQSMWGMFNQCGYTAMTTLNLGSNFDTSSVDEMRIMFKECGYTKMTSLNLGSKFDTSNVTNMYRMFVYCGYTAMTTLDLGDKFNTSNVTTHMDEMFKNCGYTAMTSLNLGPAFTQIADLHTDMFVNTGKPGEIVIKAPEAIYANRTTFKTGPTSTTTIVPQTVTYDAGGNETSRTAAGTTIELTYKPEWTKVSTTVDTTNEQIILEIKGSAYNASKDYAANVTSNLDASDIQIFIDGQDATFLAKPQKTIGTASSTTNATSGKTEITQTITFSGWEETTKQAGKSFFEWSGNLTIKIAGRGEATSTYTNDGLVDEFGNKAMMETDETGTWVAIAPYSDTTTDHNTTGKLFADFIGPKISIISSTPDTSAKTETIVFTVTDKYLDTSDMVTKNEMKIYFDGDDATEDLLDDATFTVDTANPLKHTVNGVERTVGYTYTIVLKNFEQATRTGLYKNWSGTIQLGLAENAAKDLSGNTNDTTYKADANPVDYIKPEFTYEYSETTIDKGNNVLTVVFYVADKHYDAADSTGIALSDFYNPAVHASSDGRPVFQLAGQPFNINVTGNTLTSEAIPGGYGLKYTLVVKNLEETDADGFTDGYTNSGIVSITIPADKFEDTFGNKNAAKTITIGIDDPTTGDGHNSAVKVDVVDPVWELGTLSLDGGTIKLRAIDKYFKTSTLTASDINIYVNGTLNTTITKDLTSTPPTDIKDTVDGVANTVVGKEYTLKLGEYSSSDHTTVTPTEPVVGGTVQYRNIAFSDLTIEIKANTIEDNAGNKNKLRQFELESYGTVQLEVYPVQDTTDTTNQIKTIIFNVTDKNYDSTDLITIVTNANGTINTSNANNELAIKDGANYLSQVQVHSFTNIPIKAILVAGGPEKIIGHQYTLKLKGLEENDATFKASERKYKDWSGNLQMVIDTDASRNTQGQTIDPTTATQTYMVDIVKPFVEMDGSYGHAIDQEGNVTFTISDKYFNTTNTDASTVTSDEIEVYVNGTKNTTLTPVISSPIVLKETIDGVANTQYAVRYTISLEDFAQDVKQVKIRVLANAITDKTGNGNKQTDLVFYNMLKKTVAAEYGGTENRPFLGETTVYREHINQIIFTDSLSGSTAAGVQKVWDVSAMNDGSIKAWTSQTESPFTVYIGSDYEIFANQDSTGLFAYVGYDIYNPGTDPIVNLNLLNTSSVTNMSSMFDNFGRRALIDGFDFEDNFDTSNVTNMSYMFSCFGQVFLKKFTLPDSFDTSNVTNMLGMFKSFAYSSQDFTTFELGTGFDTSNVTDMSYMFNSFLDALPVSKMPTLNINFDTSSVLNMEGMFKSCGRTGMQTLNLGSNFDTSSVTNMNSMFAYCGYTAMTSLTLPSSFDTSNVINMHYMFSQCGYESMTNLNLGSKFNTEKVQNMEYMFEKCGYTAMTSLNLGDKFDTSSVTNMNLMFSECGFTAMTSLNLGGNFKTQNVRDMIGMFQRCGYTAMTSLSLGDNFEPIRTVNMSNMFYECGYTAMTSLNLGNNFKTYGTAHMISMFEKCGYTAMTSLDLGNNFTLESAENMQKMFKECGYTSMTSLDLGPSFRIATNHTDMFVNTGKQGEIVIKAAEAIYANRTTFKLGRTSTTTVVPQTVTYDVDGNETSRTESGTIIDLAYKPEWTKVSTTVDTTNESIILTLKGSAYNASKDYAGNVTSNLENADVQVFIDGVNVTSSAKPVKTIGTPSSTTNAASGKTEITQTITLSGWQEASRQTGKSFLEWSGNVTIKILGRGQASSTYSNDGLVDEYGNKAMMETDETGSWVLKTSYSDTATDHNTAGTLFADFIKPEITLVSSTKNPSAKTETIVFTVTDKYLDTSDMLTKEEILVYFDTEDATSDVLDDATFTVDTTNPIKATVNGVEKIVGYTYTLVLKDLQQAAKTKVYRDWSGTVSIKLKENSVKDKSGNTNDPNATITGDFVDFIKPEFVYEYSETIIDKGNKILTVVFYATDKYYDATNSTGLTLANFYNPGVDASSDGKPVFQVAGQPVNINVAGNSLTPETIPGGYGLKYTLVVKNLEQRNAAGFSDGYAYSGIVSITIPADRFKDTSTNSSDAKTITIGIDDPANPDHDGNPSGETDHTGAVKVDLVDPIWELGTVDLDSGIIKLRAKDKYFSSVDIDEDDIFVYVNGHLDGDTNNNGVIDGSETPKIGKDIRSTTPTDIKDTVDGVANTVVGKEYTLKLSNITPAGSQDQIFIPTNLNELDAETRGTYQYKYSAENGGDIDIKIAAGTATDTSGNGNKLTPLDIGNIDKTKPKIYEVRRTQNAAANTETIVFNVTDKNYFDTSDLIEKTEMSLLIDNTNVSELLENATYGAPVQIKTTVDGVPNVVVGHQYTIVISNIAETTKRSGKDYLEWSGTLNLSINASAARDNKGNMTDAKSFTDFLDYAKPKVEQVAVATPINTTAKTYTMSFKVTDKYLDTTDLIGIDTNSDGKIDNLNNELTIKVDGEVASDIEWELTYSPITAIMNKTVGGSIVSNTYTIGHTYTLVLSEFEQASKQTAAGKDFLEWSGTVSIEIAGNAVKDSTGNNLAQNPTIITGEHIDFIIPRLEDIVSTSASATETITFDIMDKYLDTTNPLETSEFTVYVDGEAVVVDYDNTRATGLNGVFTKVQDYKYTVNGDTNHVVGQQYRLVLTGFDQITRNSKEYKDYSGTVSIVLNADAVKDLGMDTNVDGTIDVYNTLDSGVASTTITGDFVDYIKPDIEYTHQSSDVNTNPSNKSYSMTFTITDKYYASRELTLDDILTNENIEVLMQNGQLDGSGNPIVYNLKDEPVTIALSARPIKKTFNKTVSGGSIVNNEYTIGHEYTLTISHLEQLEIKTGLTTADYSGVITVSIAADTAARPMIRDTSNNGNTAQTLTSGVDFVGGNEIMGPGDPLEVDLVDPLWTKVSSTALAKDPTDAINATATTGTAEITIKGTDTYFATEAFATATDGFTEEDSKLSTNEIEVYVDGVLDGDTNRNGVLDAGETSTVTLSISTVTTLTETRRVYDFQDSTDIETVQYGVQYTITVNRWKQSAKQVKIRILEDAIKDETGNGNKVTDLIIYNCLESSATEPDETSGFLDGNGVKVDGTPEDGPSTGIKRNQIQQVIFVDSLDGSTASGVKKVWDVGAIADGSIKAWTSQTSAPYTVYIGSDSEIFANQDASYLFAYIGYEGTATETISNIGALNVSSVTNMTSMFEYTGYAKMSTLTLGSNFNTSNVTDMTGMFSHCGYTAMTSLTLSTSFDTSNVTNMKEMFIGTGYTAMTSLTLPSSFNTSSVTDMSEMFSYCGYTVMTSLTLPSSFDTSSVTNMSGMFSYCGYTAMTGLTLPSSFDTSNVSNMSEMFSNCGYTAMTSLTLPSSFDTSAVTDMSGMFSYCGYTAMTSLTLPSSFDTSAVTDMSEMFAYCGYGAMTSLTLHFDTMRVRNMSGMFDHCGYTAMTTLDLGNSFDTNNAEDMSNMFAYCGNTAMTVLDLGPAFTKIPSTNTDMFTDCGTSTLVVYAPESIYSDRTGFKLNN